MWSVDEAALRYWGQNSYGATHSDVANYKQRLSYYCGSDSVINAFPVAFMNVFFGTGGYPSINLDNVGERLLIVWMIAH